MVEADAIPADVLRFVAETKTCVVGTIRSDGKVRQSVTYVGVLDGRILLSTVTDRLKALDVRRSGWMSLCAFGHEPPFPSVTLEGTARFVDGNEVGPLSRRLLQKVMGVPADRLPTDAELEGAGRALIELLPTRSYGASYLPTQGT